MKRKNDFRPDTEKELRDKLLPKEVLPKDQNDSMETEKTKNNPESLLEKNV